nr:hypothetical protein [Tanacetum cinerariifolium]
MDIRDEIKISKGDMLTDSNENKHRNKLSGVKAIDRVSPIKSKSMVTGKSSSPKSRWLPMSEKIKVGKSKAAAVVSEKSTVVKESVVKSIEKSTVVKESDVTSKVGKSNVSAVVSENSGVDEKDNPKVSKPVVVADVKAPVVVAVESVVEKDNPKVASKVSDESVKKSLKAYSVVADKPSSVVVDKVDVVKDNINVVADKVVKENVLSVVAYKASNINVVAFADKASNALKNKPAGKRKKPVVGKDKDKPKTSRQMLLRKSLSLIQSRRKMILSKEDDRKKKLKGNSKKDVSDSELETDVVDYFSDEADRKRKKLKIKAGLKRKRSGLDFLDSSELDTKSKKKLTKKVEKEESDEESVPKKGKKIDKEGQERRRRGKKKEKQLTPKEAVHEEYLLIFPSFHARTTPSSLFLPSETQRVDILGFLTDIGFSSLHNVSIDHLTSNLGWFVVFKFKSYMLSFDSYDKIEVTPSKIHDMLGVPFGGYSLFDLDEREADHEFVRKWAGQFYPLELKKVRVNDIARKLIVDQEIDFLFKVNFLTLFSNTMGKADGLKGQICLDVVRRLRKDSMISDIDLCGELKDRVVRLLYLHDEWNEAEVQESEGFIGFLETSEKEYVNIFKDLISFKYDGNEDNVGDDDDENRDDDDGNVDNDADDGYGNKDEEYVNEGDKDPNGSNLSFGFSKISLEDFDNDRGPAKKDKVVEGNPTEQGTVVEGNQAEECEIMSTPENFTQWLDKNVDLVGEGDLFGDNTVTLKAMNQEITLEKLPTQKASPSPKKEMVIQSKSHGIHSESHMIYSESHSKSHEIHSESHMIYSESHVIHSESHVIHFESHGDIYLESHPIHSESHEIHFESHYAHISHTQVAKVKHTIPKLKWKTKENFHDCGIFTMLYMETFDAGPASNLDCGLLVESQLQRDMLRQLRFKFATKILLHEINVHAGKMLELAKEFDKTDAVEKMAIIVDAFKKRKERDCINLSCSFGSLIMIELLLCCSNSVSFVVF